MLRTGSRYFPRFFRDREHERAPVRGDHEEDPGAINTLAALIDESLISLRCTSGMVTDADNNALEGRKIGPDTLDSPTLGNRIKLHAERVSVKPWATSGTMYQGSSPNGNVSPVSKPRRGVTFIYLSFSTCILAPRSLRRRETTSCSQLSFRHFFPFAVIWLGSPNIFSYRCVYRSRRVTTLAFINFRIATEPRVLAYPSPLLERFQWKTRRDIRRAVRSRL